MTDQTAAAGWQPIDTAPRDRMVMVNDTTSENLAPWCAAYWIDSGAWAGWAYADDLMADAFPLGPQPTHWYDLPELQP
jgi:hypothetical protein